MMYKCCVGGSQIMLGEEWTTVFSFPKEESLHNTGQVRK